MSPDYDDFSSFGSGSEKEAAGRSDDEPGSNNDTDDRVDGSTQLGPDGRREYCERDQYWDRSQCRWRNVKTVEPEDKFKKLGRYVFVVLRVYNSRMMLNYTTVRIKGAVLRGVLQNVFRGVVGFDLGGNSLSELKDLRFLYWAKPQLLSLAEHFENANDDGSLFEIRAALNFIDKHYASTTSELESLLPDSISFDLLWAVLPPGSLVVGRDPLGFQSMWRINSHRVADNGYGVVEMVIEAEYLEWDGSNIGTVPQTLTITKFSGFMPIQDLRFVPLKYHPTRSQVIDEIMDRSERKLALCLAGAQHRQYEATALYDTGMELAKFTCRSRIMIDPKKLSSEPMTASFLIIPGVAKLRKNDRVWLSDLDAADEERRMEIAATLAEPVVDDDSDSGSSVSDYGWRAPPRRITHDRSGTSPRHPRVVQQGFDLFAASDDPQELSPEKLASKLTKEDRLILSSLVYGFSFDDDRWMIGSVERTSDIAWNRDIFDSLVIAPSLKTTMLQLLRAHRERTSNFDDIVSGKGRGLIGLLQGPPGSGKTLTAEVIAETAQMPLYVISSGALGNNANDMCKELSRILGLAAHWNAVLLVEEADVFLAKRQISDLERNSMVSVFLRELEYYQGILLLTTNHQEMMDEAFESRIHFAYNYPSPDLVSRRKIWDLQLTNAAKSLAVRVEVDEDARDVLAKMPLNGRQIKNIVGVAMKLCNGGDALTAERIGAAAQIMPRYKAGIVAHEAVNEA